MLPIGLGPLGVWTIDELRNDLPHFGGPLKITLQLLGTPPVNTSNAGPIDTFWTQPKWAKHFRWQVKPVNELLALYSSEVILDALRDRRCWNIASFGNKSKLLPLLKEKQVAYDTKMQHLMESETPVCGDITSKPRPQISKKSGLDKLKEFDEE